MDRTQQNSSKVHLKPGSHLKRTKNETSVKFKSMKMVKPKEKVVKPEPELTIEDCSRRLETASNEKDKSNLLNELNRVIHRQSESFKTQLMEFFETVTELTRDPHDEVRNTAMKIILYVLENTEDKHLRHYAIFFNKYLSAIMNHPNPKIATSTLVLLDSMVKNHPNLICYNMDILNDLIPAENAHFTRQPPFERGTYLYSQSEEVNNLGHINAFLKGMLGNESDLAKYDDEDDKDVYMDESKPMSLVLYANSGLKPIDIEKKISDQFNPPVDLFEQDKKIINIISSLVSVIPGICSRIIRCAVDNTLRSELIIDLNIVVQVLYHMVEIAKRKSDTVAIEEIATIIKEKLYLPYKRTFPFQILNFLPGISLEPLAMLNITLCFLFMKLLFSNGSCDRDWELVERFFSTFFAADKKYSSEIKFKCIPLFIKMIQLFSYKTCVPDAIIHLLKQLVIFLKTTHINHPNKKKLINFLYHMSLPAEYRFWFETEPIKLWFAWLVSHVKENINKLDRKIAKMICRISLLRHPSFMNLLDFSVIKVLLKHHNDLHKETGITLQSHMDIDNETFQNMFEIIAEDSFPRKFAVSLVQMINVRFERKTLSEKAHIDYIEFLLSTALGTYNVSRNSFVDLNDNKYSKAIQVVEHGFKYTIVPSLYWKEHRKLFEVCMPYLRCLSTYAHVPVFFSRLVQENMPGKVIPIHFALAILKLDAEFKSEDSNFDELMLELKFSFLMTLSVLTELTMDDEWHKWNIDALEDSILFTEELANRIFHLLFEDDFIKVKKPDGLVVYFILRIIKEFNIRLKLNEKSDGTIELVRTVLESLASNCSDKSVIRQPVYIELQSLFK